MFPDRCVAKSPSEHLCSAADNRWVSTTFACRESIAASDARALSARFAQTLRWNRHEVTELFHSTDGVAAPGQAPIRFTNAHGGFGLLAMGEKGIAALERVAPRMQAMWEVAIRGPIRVRMLSGVCRIGEKPARQHHVIERMVVQKKPSHMRAIADDERKHIQALISRGIARQAAEMGLTVPELGVRLISWSSARPTPIGHDCGMRCHTICDVRFETTVALEGWWAVGFLTARGLGLLDTRHSLMAGAADILEHADVAQ